MLLGIILFPLSMGFSLICRMLAFSIIHNQHLGLADWAFILGWRQRPECFNGHASSLGLTSGLTSPFFKPYQKGMLDRSFDEIFHLEILRRVSQWLNCFGNFFMFSNFIIFFLILFFLYYLFQLQDHVEYMGSAARVILVPSIRDAHHDFVFPQVIVA